MGNSKTESKKMEEWTKEEDDRLIAHISAHGEGNCRWQSLPEATGLLHRSGESCLRRWIHHLKRRTFTGEEEELIIRLHSLFGNRWSQIAGSLPGRTDEEVRNYWNAHIRDRGIDPYTHSPIKTPNHHSQQRPNLFEEPKSSANAQDSGFEPFVEDSPRPLSSHLRESDKEIHDEIREDLLSDDPSESNNFVEFHWVPQDRVEIITKPDIVEAENDLPERYPLRVESATELPLDQQPDSFVAERSMCDLSPPIVESPVGEDWLDFFDEHEQQVLDENKIIGAGPGQDNTSSSSKKGGVRRLEKEYGIDRNTLHQYSGFEPFDEDKQISPRSSSSDLRKAEEETLDRIPKHLPDEDSSESYTFVKLDGNPIVRGITAKPVAVEAEKDVPDRYPPTTETSVTKLWLDQPADIGEAERNACDQSPPRVESPVTEKRLDSSSQQPREVLDDIGRRIGVGSGKGTTTSKRKKRAVKLDEAYGIDYNTLHQYSDKKQKEAALHLGVSLSTLKRICRNHGVLRWPPRKTKITEDTLKECDQATEGSVKDHMMEQESVSNLPCLRQDSPSKTTTLKDENKIMVKVLYKDGIIIKFEISPSSTKLELEEKVAFRLNLRVGSFCVNYEDEEKEWVLVACDEDLRTCINTSRASGKPYRVRMRVSQTLLPCI